jgi:hypothetical protein
MELISIKRIDDKNYECIYKDISTLDALLCNRRAEVGNVGMWQDKLDNEIKKLAELDALIKIFQKATDKVTLVNNMKIK